MFYMSYFTAATQDLCVPVGFLKQSERLFRDADTAWIERTDFGYELSILGELHSISFSLEEAIEELDMALLHGHAKGLPNGLEVMDVTDHVWGINMDDLVRRTRAALEAL